MNLGTMLTYLDAILRDPGDGMFTPGEKLSAINITQREFADDTLCILDALEFEVSTTYAAAPEWQRLAGTPDVKVNKSTRIDGIIEFSIEDTSDKPSICLQIPEHGIRRLDPAATPDSGPDQTQILETVTEDFVQRFGLRTVSTEYPEFVQFIGENRFIIWPYPAATANCHLHVEFARTCANLADDTDIPLIPKRYHMAIVWGATALARELREMDEEAKPWRAKYEIKKQEALVAFGSRGKRPTPTISNAYY